MRPNPELNYWLEVDNEQEAQSKILAGGNWVKRVIKDMKKIKQYLGITKKDTVMDFGCGMGRLLKEVSPLCREAIGVDVSEPMLHYCYKYCLGIKNIILAFMQSETIIPLLDKQVDKIYSFLTLQHIEKPKAFRILIEFNRVLKKFGKVLIQYPNVLNEKFYFIQMKQREGMGLVCPLIEFYSRDEIDMIFERTGFELIELIDDGDDFYVIAEKVKDIPKPEPFGVRPLLKRERK